VRPIAIIILDEMVAQKHIGRFEWQEVDEAEIHDAEQADDEEKARKTVCFCMNVFNKYRSQHSPNPARAQADSSTCRSCFWGIHLARVLLYEYTASGTPGLASEFSKSGA
jgi:hypothetical protein